MPIPVSSSTQSATNASSQDVGAVITNSSCSIDDAQLRNIKKTALSLLLQANKNAYKEFPIDRKALLSSTIKSLLTKESICHVLTASSLANEGNHNDLREKFKANQLSQENGKQLGIISMRLPLKARCPKEYDWANSPVYNDADSCETVVNEIKASSGVPTAMYSAPLPAKDAADYFSDHTLSELYIRYSAGGLKMCHKEEDFSDSYNEINISSIWPTLKYVMRLFTKGTWSAWTLLKNCEDENGNTYAAGDLMFDFGLRVFTPVTTLIDGKISEQTIVISQVAVASNNPLAKHLPENLPFNRFIGGKYAERLLLIAKANGWKIEMRN